MDIRNIKYILYILAFYFTVSTAIINNETTFIFIIIGMLIISMFYKKQLRDIYIISILTNIVMGAIMISSFQKLGSFFDAGGDDSLFFNHFLNASEGSKAYVNFRYSNYIRLGLYYIKGLSFLGVKNITPLTVYPLNWFIGANVCVGTFILAKRFGLNTTRSRVTAILLSIYPFFVYYEVIILRDIFTALLIMLFIITYTSKWKRVIKYSILLIIGLITTRVRGEAILYILIFVGADIFFNLYHNNKKQYAYALAIVSVIIIIATYSTLLNYTGRDATEIVDLVTHYSELRSGSTAENSLGSILKSKGPLFSPIIILYMWISPFPPPILYNTQLHTIIISIGVLFWYAAFIKMFLYLISLYRKKSKSNNLLIVSKLATFITASSLIIALISADSRHLIPFFPLAFILYRVLKEEISAKQEKKINIIVLIAIFSMMSTYAYLKFS